VHDFCQRPQYFWMDITVLHTLHSFTLLVHRADGLEHRIQRSPDIVVRRRNNRTETQGVDGFIGVYLVYVWNIVDLPFGIFIRMENRRIAEYTLSDHVYMPCHFGTNQYYICYTYISFSNSTAVYFNGTHAPVLFIDTRVSRMAGFQSKKRKSRKGLVLVKRMGGTRNCQN